MIEAEIIEPQQSLRSGDVIYHDFGAHVVRETLSVDGIIREIAEIDWNDRETAEYLPIHILKLEVPEDDTPVRPLISLKFWQNSGELSKLAEVCEAWWNKVQEWMNWSVKGIDAETAPIHLVDLLAWQSDIDRFDGEPEPLYRKRVRFALANARDAGSKAGFERIWKRLELGTITHIERADVENWDVVRLQLDEDVFGRHVWLLDSLIRQYGRTCRRYEVEFQAMAQIGLRPFNFDLETENTKAVL